MGQVGPAMSNEAMQAPPVADAHPDLVIEKDPTESLADFAYRRIEDLIVSMELKPGDWVSEPQIAQMLGLGRTPVREALMRLSTERLLVQRPRRGMSVCEIDASTQLHVLEVRRPLELTLVRSAAIRRTEREAHRLAEIVSEFEELIGTRELVNLLRIDRAFIQHLIVCSKNSFLSSILPLYALSRRFWLAYEDRQHHFEAHKLTHWHIQIGRAVIAGDEAEAARLSSDYLDYVEAFAKHVAVNLI